MVRMVRSLADRTFQPRSVQRSVAGRIPVVDVGVHCELSELVGWRAAGNGALRNDAHSKRGMARRTMFWEVRMSRRAAAGRAELLAKKGHTGRVQNPGGVSENRPACGTAQHTLAVCFVFEKLEKSRKKLVKIWRNLSKIWAKFVQILSKNCESLEKNSKHFSNF